MFTMMCKAVPCKKLACMIDADAVANRHVRVSFRICHIVLRSIMSSILGHRVLGAHAGSVNVVVCVESHVLSACIRPHLSTVVLRFTGDHV